MITECVFLERLADGGVLCVGDLTADEKRQLYQHFIAFGATEGFAYDRLFKEGFQPWEMRGILGCRIDFLHRIKNEGVNWEIREATDEELKAVEESNYPTPDPSPQRGGEYLGISDSSLSGGEMELFHYRLFYPMPDGSEHSIDLNRKGDWWLMLGELKRRVEFGRWMQERGMKSLTTVTKRFSTDDWREFERVGVQQVVKSFCEKGK